MVLGSRPRVPGTAIAHTAVLLWCYEASRYAKPGTDILSYAFAMRCPVLTWLSGTDIAYNPSTMPCPGPTHLCSYAYPMQCPVLEMRNPVLTNPMYFPICYAMSGTDTGSPGTRQAVYSLSHQFFLVLSYASPTRCPLLRYRILYADQVRRGIYVLVWRAVAPSSGQVCAYAFCICACYAMSGEEVVLWCVQYRTAQRIQHPIMHMKLCSGRKSNKVCCFQTEGAMLKLRKVSTLICLRSSYAMSGTDVLSPLQCLIRTIRILVHPSTSVLWRKL
eukprot:3940414-Rhodomonas_salina.1